MCQDQAFHWEEEKKKTRIIKQSVLLVLTAVFVHSQLKDLRRRRDKEINLLLDMTQTGNVIELIINFNIRSPIL